MKVKTHTAHLKLLRVPKHELHQAIKEHVEWREDNEEVKNTLVNLKVWYKKFRLFLYQYDVRNVSMTTDGIAKAYVEWLEGNDYANSYVKHNFKHFLATINRLGIYHNITGKELFRNYATESRANEDFFLTNEEVKQLINLQVDNSIERIILDKFLVSCFTGCRLSEISTVRVEDKDTLSYWSTKTKKNVLVPFNEVVKPFIESGRYKFDLDGKNNYLKNDTLHKILERLGWNGEVKKYRLVGKTKCAYSVPRHKAITFHSARKFFGKMLLDMDVSMYKVSQLLGHSNIDTTQKYYAALTRGKMLSETNELINKF